MLSIHTACPVAISETTWKIEIHSVSERDSSQLEVELIGKLSISSAMLD